MACEILVPHQDQTHTPAQKCRVLTTGPPGKSLSFSFKQSFITCFPGGTSGKDPPANAGNAGSIPGSGRSPGIGNGTPLQYSCLENSMGRGAWWATVHGATKSRTWLSNWAQSCTGMRWSPSWDLRILAWISSCTQNNQRSKPHELFWQL